MKGTNIEPFLLELMEIYKIFPKQRVSSRSKCYVVFGLPILGIVEGLGRDVRLCTEYSASPLSHINRFTVTPTNPSPSSTACQLIIQSHILIILVTSWEE
jgi:hypothetical protein